MVRKKVQPIGPPTHFCFTTKFRNFCNLGDCYRRNKKIKTAVIFKILIKIQSNNPYKNFENLTRILKMPQWVYGNILWKSDCYQTLSSIIKHIWHQMTRTIKTHIKIVLLKVFIQERWYDEKKVQAAYLWQIIINFVTTGVWNSAKRTKSFG